MTDPTMTDTDEIYRKADHALACLHTARSDDAPTEKLIQEAIGDLERIRRMTDPAIETSLYRCEGDH